MKGQSSQNVVSNAHTLKDLVSLAIEQQQTRDARNAKKTIQPHTVQSALSQSNVRNGLTNQVSEPEIMYHSSSMNKAAPVKQPLRGSSVQGYQQQSQFKQPARNNEKPQTYQTIQQQPRPRSSYGKTQNQVVTRNKQQHQTAIVQMTAAPGIPRKQNAPPNFMNNGTSYQKKISREALRSRDPLDKQRENIHPEEINRKPITQKTQALNNSTALFYNHLTQTNPSAAKNFAKSIQQQKQEVKSKTQTPTPTVTETRNGMREQPRYERPSSTQAQNTYNFTENRDQFTSSLAAYTNQNLFNMGPSGDRGNAVHGNSVGLNNSQGVYPDLSRSQKQTQSVNASYAHSGRGGRNLSNSVASSHSSKKGNYPGVISQTTQSGTAPRLNANSRNSNDSRASATRQNHSKQAAGPPSQHQQNSTQMLMHLQTQHHSRHSSIHMIEEKHQPYSIKNAKTSQDSDFMLRNSGGMTADEVYRTIQTSQIPANQNMLSMFTTTQKPQHHQTINSGRGQPQHRPSSKPRVDSFSKKNHQQQLREAGAFGHRTSTGNQNVSAGPVSSSSKNSNTVNDYSLARNFNFYTCNPDSKSKAKVIKNSAVIFDSSDTIGEVVFESSNSHQKQNSSISKSIEVKRYSLNGHDPQTKAINYLMSAHDKIQRSAEDSLENSIPQFQLHRNANQTPASQSSLPLDKQPGQMSLCSQTPASYSQMDSNYATLQTGQSPHLHQDVYKATSYQTLTGNTQKEEDMVSPCAGGGTRQTPTATSLAGCNKRTVLQSVAGAVMENHHDSMSITSNQQVVPKSKAKQRFEVLCAILKFSQQDDNGAKSATGATKEFLQNVESGQELKQQQEAVFNVLEEIISSQTNKYDFQALRLATDFQHRLAKTEKILLQNNVTKLTRDLSDAKAREQAMAAEIQSLRTMTAALTQQKERAVSPPKQLLQPQLPERQQLSQTTTTSSLPACIPSHLINKRMSAQPTYTTATRSELLTGNAVVEKGGSCGISPINKIEQQQREDSIERKRNSTLVPKLDLSRVKNQFEHRDLKKMQTIPPKKAHEKTPSAQSLNTNQKKQPIQAMQQSKIRSKSPGKSSKYSKESSLPPAKDIDVKVNNFFGRQTTSAVYKTYVTGEHGHQSNKVSADSSADIAAFANKTLPKNARAPSQGSVNESRNHIDLQNVVVVPAPSYPLANQRPGSSTMQPKKSLSYMNQSLVSPNGTTEKQSQSIVYMHELQQQKQSSYEKSIRSKTSLNMEHKRDLSSTLEHPGSAKLHVPNQFSTVQPAKIPRKMDISDHPSKNKSIQSSYNSSIDESVTSSCYQPVDDLPQRQGRFATVEVTANERKRSLPPVKIPLLDFSKLAINVQQKREKSQTQLKQAKNALNQKLQMTESNNNTKSGPIKQMTQKQALIQQLKAF